ncbi:MAG: hypothetical protein ABI145_17850 [Steroidobacteraceae bacterium]
MRPTIETETTIIDQILEQHHRFLGRLFSEARRKHHQRFADAGKAANDKVRAHGRSVI